MPFPKPQRSATTYWTPVSDEWIDQRKIAAVNYGADENGLYILRYLIDGIWVNDYTSEYPDTASAAAAAEVYVTTILEPMK